jgi:hypothetical protein
MSDQTSIFNESTPTTSATTVGSTTTPSPELAELTTLLTQVKNENGEPKYKTVKDALIGLQHAQAHIQTLLTEKRTVEEELGTLRPVATKVTELEGLVRRLTESSTPTATPAAQGMSEEAVATLVEQTLTRQQQAQIATANLGKVVEAVKKAHGDKAEEVFYQKAKELGMTQAEVNTLAARTPAAVLRLLGLEATSSGQQVTQGTVNTTGLAPNTESNIGRNKKVLPIGATHQQIMEEATHAKAMVEELTSKGISIDDLTKPSNFFKYLGN